MYSLHGMALTITNHVYKNRHKNIVWSIAIKYTKQDQLEFLLVSYIQNIILQWNPFQYNWYNYENCFTVQKEIVDKIMNCWQILNNALNNLDDDANCALRAKLMFRS
jgi:hypothetical protein